MSELNLKCHFQMVRNKTQYGEEFTVHEAFSTDKGVLYMISPVPVYVVGDSKEDIADLASMIEKDIEAHGTLEMPAIQAQFDRYLEYTQVSFKPIEPDFSEDNLMNPEEELIEHEDFHDKEGNVLDLVQFMNKRR